MVSVCRRTISTHYELIASFLLFLFLLTTRTILGEESTSFPIDDRERAHLARIAAKPWYTRQIQVGNAELPFSYTSVMIAFMSVLYLYYSWATTQSFAEAAHILLSDPADTTKAVLEEWKKDIGSDFTKFAKYAKEHSECPSKQAGGNLGRFRKNDMAPSFDRAVFDKDTPLKTTIGPIRTPFGWHLIYVHSRQLSK